MEILIVGVLVVALMVYVSTKIKKSAASAFENEAIENEDFRLVKPEGFINPINENSKFAFEAYSKEFGKNDADELRQAQISLIVISNSNFENLIKNLKKSDEKILSENFLENASDEQKVCLVESEKIEKGVPVREFYKIVESAKSPKIYQLQVSVLSAYINNYADKINELFESFVVK